MCCVQVVIVLGLLGPGLIGQGLVLLLAALAHCQTCPWYIGRDTAVQQCEAAGARVALATHREFAVFDSACSLWLLQSV
jgi:hypothetical protein